MFKNYLKIAIRNIAKYKVFSFINITGLAIGLAVFLMIILFINNELQYDRFHANYDRIYRVVSGDPQDKNSYAGSPSPLGPMLVENIPEIIDMVRFDRAAGVLQYGDKAFYEKRIFYADPSFFKVFSFNLIKGNLINALKNPENIVITKSAAKKYFGNADPIGKVMRYNDNKDFIVTAIAEDVPEKSHLHFDFIVPYENFANLEHWGMWNYFTYVLVHEKTDSEVIRDKFNKWAKTHGKKNLAEGLYFQPLKDIHFQYNRSNLEPAFNKTYIRVYIAVAILVLLLACINFIILTTAKSSGRALEVGIKKTLGSTQKRLVFQFMGETFLITGIALATALLLVETGLPLLTVLSGRALSIDYFNIGFLFGLTGILVFTAVIAGAYPSFVLASSKPINVIKGIKHTSGSGVLRNIFVIFQFIISISLMVGSIMIFEQMQFIKNKDLGFNTEHIVNIRLNQNIMDQAVTIKNEFLKLASISKASINSYEPTNINWHQSVRWSGQQESERTSMWIVNVDRDFFNTLNIPILEGEEMIKHNKSGEHYKYVINESAKNLIGWKSAKGKVFSIYKDHPGKIIGVTEDFHFRSIHHAIAPYVMMISDKGRGRHISLKINSADIPGTINDIKKTWEQFAAGFEFDYYFLDENFNILYQTDDRLGRLIVFFTLLSLLIACLGLFGLTLFISEQRTKEIGIRKVLGATGMNVITLLTKDFVKLVLIANLIAWPIVWYAMNKWLQNFAYKIEIGWWVFILAGGIALIIALLTVSYQAIRAATANPVESLRYE